MENELEIYKSNLDLFASKINKRANEHEDKNLKNAYESLCEAIMYLELCIRNSKNAN